MKAFITFQTEKEAAGTSDSTKNDTREIKYSGPKTNVRFGVPDTTKDDETIIDKASSRKRNSNTPGRSSYGFGRRRSRARALQDQQYKLFTADNLLQLGAVKLLNEQSADTFTYRCIDCCHNPKVCVKATINPCAMNGNIAAELGTGEYNEHCRLCLLSPFFYGSYWSVGKNKIYYRTKHSIPGLASDDYVLSCVCPCCIIAQLQNQLDAEKFEREKVLLLLARALQHGDEISRI